MEQQPQLAKLNNESSLVVVVVVELKQLNKSVDCLCMLSQADCVSILLIVSRGTSNGSKR